jgi:hypothetical protein
MPVKEGLLAQPINTKEKEACSKKLSPSDLFKIVVSKYIPQQFTVWRFDKSGSNKPQFKLRT